MGTQRLLFHIEDGGIDEERIENIIRDFFNSEYALEIDGNLCLNGYCDFLGTDNGIIGVLTREMDRFILEYNCICGYTCWETGNFKEELPVEFINIHKLCCLLNDQEWVFWYNTDAVKRDYSMNYLNEASGF